MIPNLFDELCGDVGFGEADRQRLVAAAPHLRAHFPEVVDAFYEVVRANASMRTVFEDDAQIERQKASLLVWLEEIFSGEYDESYVGRHANVGRVHVRIGLAQRHMTSMMSVVRRAIGEAFLEATPSWDAEERFATLRSIDRILDIDLAIMLETYSLLYLERMRANERLVTLGQLAASVGHELRNPLAVVDSSAHLLLRRELDPHVEKHTRRIKEQAELCAQIVEGLMDIARDLPINRAPTALHRLVEEVVGENPAVTLDVEDVTVSLDPALTRMLLNNLVSNALQAGAEHITVRLRRDADQARLEVEDDGPGIPELVLSRLFEPLVSGRQGGVGLGLALCARIVREHGGRIAGQNLARGARFTADFPRERGA